jgi:hypothetical protein
LASLLRIVGLRRVNAAGINHPQITLSRSVSEYSTVNR